MTEVVVTDPVTGGKKGKKLARFSQMPLSAVLELAEHYGKGDAKYPGDEQGPNYAKGYKLSLSIDAAYRHLTAFAAGETLDPETGSKHVIALAWHALFMAWLIDNKPEMDDRWEGDDTDDGYIADELKTHYAGVMLCAGARLPNQPHSPDPRKDLSSLIATRCVGCGKKIYVSNGNWYTDD